MDKKIIAKIQKCLALSKSDNPNEAATALKQAYALMRTHDVGMADVALSNVMVDKIKCPISFPLWQTTLIGICCELFGVMVYQDSSNRQDVHLCFYGVGNKAQLASYAYSVLLRQLRKQRRDYMSHRLSHVRTTKTKSFRADEFCLGWVVAVRSNVKSFIERNRNIKEKELLLQYRSHLGCNGVAKSRSSHSRQYSDTDRLHGYAKGKRAELFHAMNTVDDGLLLEN